MSKKVFYDAEAREKVLGGAKALYDAVKVTFGPKGRNVVIEKRKTQSINLVFISVVIIFCLEWNDLNNCFYAS